MSSLEESLKKDGPSGMPEGPSLLPDWIQICHPELEALRRVAASKFDITLKMLYSFQDEGNGCKTR